MKQKIRSEILGKLNLQPPQWRLTKSRLIKEKLFQEEGFKKAGCVMFYVSTRGEVDTRVMISETLEMGKRVCVPFTLEDSKSIVASEIEDLGVLKPGPYGIYQPEESRVRPVPLEDIDLVVVPGVAFDSCCIRLGRGHGYYDRFLSALPKDTETIGLAFDFQVLERLPKDPHDVPVSKTITA